MLELCPKQLMKASTRKVKLLILSVKSVFGWFQGFLFVFFFLLVFSPFFLSISRQLIFQ